MKDAVIEQKMFTVRKKHDTDYDKKRRNREHLSKIEFF